VIAGENFFPINQNKIKYINQ